MPTHPSDTEPPNWHRYFAIESNNCAWALAAKPSRTPEETIEMLNAAHAAALHWNAVGTELHRMRAKALLAEAHVLAGLGPSALRLAEEVRSYFLSRETEDWELAIVHSIHAHAAAGVGASDLHGESYRAAEAAIDAISDPEDREIVLQTFSQVPAPAHA